MRKLNKASVDLIKEFEGWRSQAYKDSVGVWTIGYGHTSMAGSPTVSSGMVISLETGEEILRRDLQKFQSSVEKYVKVDLNDNQYGALVSFTYNLGERNFSKSTLLKKVNAQDWSGAANEFRKWNKAGGKVLKGLVRRRDAERLLFLTPAGTDKPVESIKEVPTTALPEKKEVPSVTFTDLFKRWWNR